MAKILVADRAPNVRRMLTNILSRGGHTVIEADKGGQALEKAGAEYPDLIIVDSNIPGVGGLEVVENLKKNPATEPIPIIVMGESTRGESAALRAGATNYMIKPLQSNAVQAIVKAALRESKTTTAPRARAANESTTEVEVEAPATPRSSGPLATGIAQLDQILRGGIPAGSLALVEGNPSSGKSVLCQHITHEALRAGHGVSYFTSEHTAETLSSQMDSIGLDSSQYLRAERFRIHPLEKPTVEGTADNLGPSLVENIEQILGQGNVVIVDSITNHVRHMRENDVIGTFSAFSSLCRDERTIFLVARSYAFDRNMLNRLHSLCPTHFSLGEESQGARTVKTIRVSKVRNVDLETRNVVEFDVVPGVGIKYIPGGRVRV